MLHLMPVPPTCMALSDAGLFAAASGGMLVVADARTQEIVVRAGFGANDFFSRQIGDREARIVAQEARDEIAALRFAVCRIAEDRMLAPRLLAVRASGFTTVWTFEQSSLGDWFGFRSAAVALHVQGRILAIQVLDPMGQDAQCTAEDVQRAKIEQESPDGGNAHTPTHFHTLLVVSEQAATLHDQVTGACVGQATLPEQAHGAQLVTRPRGRMLLTVSPSSIMALTLPRLDTSHRIQRHVPPTHEVVTAPPAVSIEAQGDFVELSDGQQLRLWTAFAHQPHAETPNMCLFTPRTLPLAPGVGAGGYLASFAGWLGSSAGATLAPGAQIDAAIGGPRRPPLPKLPARVGPAPGRDEETLVPLATTPGAGTPAPEQNFENKSWLGSYQKSFANLASGSARSQAQLNMQLLHKRDEILTK